MRILATVALVSLALIGAAAAQSDDPPPASCQNDANRHTTWRTCYDATPPGSPWHLLAAINLGSDAYLRADYAAAVAFYDEGRPPSGQQLYSDIGFHALRGAAYGHVGRVAEGQADADIAFRMLHRDPSIPASPSDYFPSYIDPEMIYVLILPLLQAGDQTRFQTALQEFRALPASDWLSYTNRAGVLDQIGDSAGALEMSSRALALAPNQPGAQNNHCAILYGLRRYAEALPYCEAATAGAPNIAAVRDSMSDLYAALGRCGEAQRENAEARRLDPSRPDYREAIVCTLQ